MRRCVEVVALILVTATAHAAERRPGVIELSNGEKLTGEIGFTSAAVRIYDDKGKRYINLAQDELVDISFHVATRSMEHPWRFKNAGSDEKEILPGEYPVLELASEVRVKAGRALKGHLMSAPVTIRVPAGENAMDRDTKKFLLKYQYKGEVGQTEKDIVFVTKIAFTDIDPAAEGPQKNGTISGTIANGGKLEHVAAFGIERGRAYDGKVNATKNTFRLADLPQDTYDIVVLTDTNIFIGLSDIGASVKGEAGPLEPTDAPQLAAQIAVLNDFFDIQKVLALKGHRDTAKILVHQIREKEQHAEEGLKGKQLLRLDIWLAHFLETEWKLDPQGRANLLRYFEPRGGPFRPIRPLPILGGVVLELSKHPSVVLDVSFPAGLSDPLQPVPVPAQEKKP